MQLIEACKNFNGNTVLISFYPLEEALLMPLSPN